MSHTTWSGRGSYTNHFTSIAAGEIVVRGLPSGSAGSHGPFNSALSSSPATFAISPDLAFVFPIGAARKLMPARPATQANVPGLEPFALAA